VLLLPGLAACSSLGNCPKEQDPRIVQLSSSADGAGGGTGKKYTDPFLGYESAPLSGPLAEFPAQTQVVFVHNLGAQPEFLATELSFSPNGIAGGDLSENAGSQGEITCVDDNVIVVKNGTCENSFFIRVTAIASGTVKGSKPCPLAPADAGTPPP